MQRWFTLFALFLTLPALAQDADLDGFDDDIDNCPAFSNQNQADEDNDGVGDACDNCLNTENSNQVDADADGYGDECDNCVYTSNDQEDYDYDGFGNDCDWCYYTPSDTNADIDEDGLGDECDNCPVDENPDQLDQNGNGMGAACDPYDDVDEDGKWTCSQVSEAPPLGGLATLFLLIATRRRR